LSGSTGMLGQSLLAEILKKKVYEVYVISHSKSIPVTNATRLTLKDVENFKFYAFFHCAAEVNVNLCELDFEHAINVNSKYTKLLFEKVRSEFSFYISTDSVYGGDKGNYNEMSDVAPVNNYAKSKLLGELFASIYTTNLYIIRTNIFGDKSRNNSSLFEWAKRELLMGNSIHGFTNVLFNPLSVSHLSFILLTMLEVKPSFGVYNIGCDSHMSKFDFLLKVAEFFGSNTSLVIPAKFEACQVVAARPLDTTMDCNKIKKSLYNLDLSFQTSLVLLKMYKNEQN